MRVHSSRAPPLLGGNKDAHPVLRTSATFADQTPRQFIRDVKHLCMLPVLSACSGLWCTTCNAPQAQINISWSLRHADTTQGRPLDHQPGRACNTLVQGKILIHLLPLLLLPSLTPAMLFERMSDKPAGAYPRARSSSKGKLAVMMDCRSARPHPQLPWEGSGEMTKDDKKGQAPVADKTTKRTRWEAYAQQRHADGRAEPGISGPGEIGTHHQKIQL